MSRPIIAVEWLPDRAGHVVWWDRHIQGGSRFSSEIDRALKEAEAVIVLWSPASVQSAWVISAPLGVYHRSSSVPTPVRNRRRRNTGWAGAAR